MILKDKCVLNTNLVKNGTGNGNDNGMDMVYPDFTPTIYDFIFYGCVSFSLLSVKRDDTQTVYCNFLAEKSFLLIITLTIYLV